MREELIKALEKITPEEAELLAGGDGIRQERYTDRGTFVVDSRKLMEQGRLIQIRPHTRFAYFPRHRHDYVEMVYMCRGVTTHVINGRDRIVLEAGDLLMLNQSVYHEILPAGREDLAVNFIILPQFFDRALPMMEAGNVLRDFLLSTLSRASSPASYLHIPTRGMVPVENLLENMIWTLLNHPGGTASVTQTTMALLFVNLSLYAGQLLPRDPEKQEQALVFQALDYIETHYRDGTLAQAAERAGLAPYALSRLLTRYTGENFKRLLQKRKLEQAAWLLTNTPLPKEAILEAVGYDNSSYFYRRFREVYGCTPGEYRKQSGAS